MRLIMEVQVGDGFTYSCTNTLQLEAPSAEDALCELEKLVMAADPNFAAAINFYGWELDPTDFFFYTDSKREFYVPDIYTIDEWFALKYPSADQ